MECGSVVGCLDPRLHEWLAYRPLQKDLLSGNEDLGVSLNHTIANATLPLIQSSPLGSYGICDFYLIFYWLVVQIFM